VLALSSALLVHALVGLAHAPLPQLIERAALSNAILAAMAIGGVWFVPSRASYTLALVAALLAVFFALGLSAPLSRLGLPISFFPFVLSVLLLLSAVRQRVTDQPPVLAEIAAEGPEELLLFHVSRRASSSDPYAPRCHLPFRGAWTCTQGVDGMFTHRGALRFAFDFEVYGDPDGALCSGEGARPEDYYCYGLPVLAAADGTVVAVESGVEDNAIGAVHPEKHWGNHVIVQHAAAVYSVVGHLVPGTPSVYPGQLVRRGALLGYCGNSGRSPRPHLHFQLQSGPSLGSPTLPCRFATAIARSGEVTTFVSDLSPIEGQAVRNLEPDGTLAAFFELVPGQTLSYRSGAQVEEIESGVDCWGRPQLRSRSYGSSLLYSRDERSFLSADLLDAQRSALRLARVALPRVPLEQLDGLTWSEWLPGRWIWGPLRAVVWDVLAPFSARAGVELFYRASLEHGRLVIVGTSQRESERGRPVVTTRAELVRGEGPVVLELCAGHRKQRAERVFSAPSAARQDATGAVRLHTDSARLRTSASPLSMGDGS
jgi:murein DD-endopeptidase MepM/ murein hydrolase activator NlpD